MLAQIKIMARLELCNLLGINILRFTKDKRKKKRAVMLSVLWILLIIMLFFMWAAFPGSGGDWSGRRCSGLCHRHIQHAHFCLWNLKGGKHHFPETGI